MGPKITLFIDDILSFILTIISISDPIYSVAFFKYQLIQTELATIQSFINHDWSVKVALYSLPLLLITWFILKAD